MKSLSRFLIIVFSFIIAGHATGHSTAGKPHLKTIHGWHCSGANVPDLRYSNANTTQDDIPLFLAEEDFSIDKHLLLPITFQKTTDTDYRLQQWITRPDKRQINQVALITDKLPIYLLHHTLLIPFA